MPTVGAAAAPCRWYVFKVIAVEPTDGIRQTVGHPPEPGGGVFLQAEAQLTADTQLEPAAVEAFVRFHPIHADRHPFMSQLVREELRISVHAGLARILSWARVLDSERRVEGPQTAIDREQPMTTIIALP